VTDLLAILQEPEHLGLGLVSLNEALDLTTPAGRAMAALLAVFAAFEREILQERVRAGLAHPDRTARNWAGSSPPDDTPHRCGSCIVPASANLRSPAGYKSDVPPYAGFWADLLPREITSSSYPTQPYQKDTTSSAGRPLVG